MKLVLLNRKEVSVGQLKKARQVAVEQYYKSQRLAEKHIRIKAEALDVIRGCDGRIRLLTLLEKQ